MVPANSVGYNTDVVATLHKHAKSQPPLASVPAETAVQANVTAALAALAKVDAGKLVSTAPSGPTKPVVKSFTQINHVSESSERTSTAKNAALDAYKRRLVLDPHAPKGGAYELDKGTMNQDRPKDTRTRAQRKADDEVERQARMDGKTWNML